MEVLKDSTMREVRFLVVKWQAVERKGEEGDDMN